MIVDVFRVENEEGTGPYWYRGDIEYDHPLHALLRPHNESGIHPSPWSEGIEVRSGDHCGFESLTKLREWFRPFELEVLKEYGFKLAHYEVPAEFVRKGNRQLMFKRASAKLISRDELV